MHIAHLDRCRSVGRCAISTPGRVNHNPSKTDVRPRNISKMHVCGRYLIVTTPVGRIMVKGRRTVPGRVKWRRTWPC